MKRIISDNQENLEQIKEKGYHEKYLADNREVYIVGMNFDSAEKNITDFEWEQMGN